MTTMNQRTWDALTPEQRKAQRDMSDLSPQLAGLEGTRVEIKDNQGEVRRFWVGLSTGWRPCHLEIHNSRSLGGGPADKSYQSVTVVRWGPRR